MEAAGVRQRVREAVDSLRDEIVSYGQEILRIESITGNEKRCSDWVAAGLREMGLEVESLEAEANRPNIVARLRGTEGRRTLDFNSHTDVVPPGDLKEWVSDPFAAGIRDGKIFARGAADCKGGIICAVSALKALRRAGVGLKGDVLLAFTVGDEEGAAQGMRYVVEQGKFKADAAIQGDPTPIGLKGVTTAHMSSLWFEITVRGRSAHCSFPWNGINACSKMARIINGMEGLKIPHEPHSLFPDGPFITPATTISGGVNRMMVPESCTATFYMTLLPEQDRRQGLGAIESMLKEIKGKDAEVDCEIRELAFNAGDEVKAHHEIVRTLQRAAVEITGVEPKPVGMPVASSSSFIHNLARTPIIVWGPGDGWNSDAHRANEWVGIQDVIDVTKVYSLVCMDFLGYEA